MSAARSYEPALRRFVKLMTEKLAKPENVAKTHWRRCDLEFLLDRLEQEVGELRTAIDCGDGMKAIQDECADVANFAMMIADWHR